MFSVGSRAVGAVFDDLVAFFRPTYSHVREEKQRLELTREDAGDTAPPLRRGADGVAVRLAVPPGYEPPNGPRRGDPPSDSRGLVV
ncbi:DUF6191 domain-containing protein [Fodinibacter luteus]